MAQGGSRCSDGARFMKERSGTSESTLGRRKGSDDGSQLLAARHGGAGGGAWFLPPRAGARRRERQRSGKKGAPLPAKLRTADA